MDAGANIERIRSRHLEDVSTNADPVDVTLTILQPKASEINYGACSNIDQHNRRQQESLDVEKKIQTNEWDPCFLCQFLVFIRRKLRLCEF